jgi:hypothetical protein
MYDVNNSLQEWLETSDIDIQFITQSQSSDAFWFVLTIFYCYSRNS